MNPWEVLGLDPSEATAKEVKRAYAKLLKIHRPDTDPEKFQEIREAYEMTRDWLSVPPSTYIPVEMGEPLPMATVEEPAQTTDQQEVEEAKNDSDSEAELEPKEEAQPALDRSKYDAVSVVQESIDLPNPLRERLTEMEKAISTDTWYGGEGSVESAYIKGQNYCRDFPRYLASWGAAVVHLFAGYEDEFSDILSIEDILFELRQDVSVQTQFVCEFFDQNGRLISLGHIGKALAESKPPIETTAGAFTAWTLAQWLAIAYSHEIAPRLLDIAYPHLPVRQRDAMAQSVQYLIHSGQILRPCMNRESLQFWSERFRDQRRGLEFDWSDEAAQEELALRRRENYLDRPMKDVISTVLPPEMREEFYKQLKLNVEPPERHLLDEPVEPIRPAEPKTNYIPFIIGGLVVLFFIGSFVKDRLDLKPKYVYKRHPIPSPVMSTGDELTSQGRIPLTRRSLQGVSYGIGKSMIDDAHLTHSTKEVQLWLTSITLVPRGIDPEIVRYASQRLAGVGGEYQFSFPELEEPPATGYSIPSTNSSFPSSAIRR